MPGLAHNSVWPALALVCLAGCAGSTPKMSTADRYRELRTAEAELEHAESYGDGAPVGGRAHAVCAAADRICQIAEELSETDAALRCEAARRRCSTQGSGSQRGAR